MKLYLWRIIAVFGLLCLPTGCKITVPLPKKWEGSGTNIVRQSHISRQNLAKLNEMDNKARAMLIRGDFQGGVKLYEEAVTKAKSWLGPKHQFTAILMGNLGGAYRVVGYC